MKTQPPYVVLAAVFAASGLVVGLEGCSSKKTTTPVIVIEEEGGTTPSPTDSGTVTPQEDSGTVADTGVPDDTGTGSSDAAKDAVADTGLDSGVCLSTTTGPDAGGACVGGACTATCAQFTGDYKAGVAEEINKCLTLAICGGAAAATIPCVDKAVAKACADPTAATFCTPNVNGCKASNPADTITQVACIDLAKAMTTAGRTRLQTCFETEFNCGDCPAMLKSRR